MKTAEKGPLVDACAVAKVLGIEPRVVYELRLKGRIPGYKLNRRTIRFSLSEVLAALKTGSEAKA